MSKRLFLLSAVLFVGAWVLMWPRGGYAQTATATYVALPLQLVAAVLAVVGARRELDPARRRSLVVFGSLSLLMLGVLFAASNLFFWNGGP